MRAGRRSQTAQYVALVRALLTDKGVIDDPFAVKMLSPTMSVAHKVLRRVPRLTDSAFYAALAARTAVFDDAVVGATHDGMTQVVIVAAGYDARAWRFASAGVRFFEVDHPATQADKRRRAPSPSPDFVACDLRSDPLAERLSVAGFDRAAPAAFLVEGLTMYLSVADVSNLLAQLAAIAAPGSRLVVNFAAPQGTGGRSEPRNRLLASLGRLQGEPFGEARNLSDAAALVAAAGWHDAATTTLAAAAQRFAGTTLDIARIGPTGCVITASI